MAEYRRGSNALVQADTAVTGAGQLKTKTESQKLAAANEARVALVVFNTGTKDVYLGLGTAAVKEKGVFLPAETGRENIDYFWGEVTAISAEEEPIVSFVEV